MPKDRDDSRALVNAALNLRGFILNHGDGLVKIKTGITFIFRLHRRPIQLVEWDDGEA